MTEEGRKMFELAMCSMIFCGLVFMALGLWIIPESGVLGFGTGMICGVFFFEGALMVREWLSKQ